MISNAELQEEIMLNGTYVRDILSPNDKGALSFFYQDNKTFEFFLIQDFKGQTNDVNTLKAVMNDGYLGLAPS